MRGWVVWVGLALVVFLIMQGWRGRLEAEVDAYNQRVEAYSAEYHRAVKAALPDEAEVAEMEKSRKALDEAMDRQEPDFMEVTRAATEGANMSQRISQRLASTSPPHVVFLLRRKFIECLKIDEKTARTIATLFERAAARTLTEYQYNQGMAQIRRTDQQLKVCRQQITALGDDVDKEFAARAVPLERDRKILEQKRERYRLVAWGLRLGSAAVGLVGSRKK